ncbi:hypothetical protein PYW07_002630 [Mythimna separata]|uniref:FP protein C-terminal domain-containing protein n=1 Tax=Mythimna separata TaxID=271217 RepID=A0AAD7YFM9_MYTSE|nr:hypothetical protein PYW07_002630 [Mythimna separata]
MEDMSKSLSESNIPGQTDQRTPPNFVFQRSKRPRECYCDSDFLDFKEEVKTLISSLMSPQQEELKKIYPTLMAIKSTNDNIEVAMASLSAQNEELKRKIQQLEIQSTKDRNYITILEDKIEDLQRGSRRANFEIKNVPKLVKESKEELIKMAISLSNEIGSNISHTDISDIFRVQNKRAKTKNSTIVVEMSSTILKANFLKKSRDFNKKHNEKLCAKHLGFKTEESTPVYVSEQLTVKGARLHFLARDLAKSKGYKYCWTAYGKIYVKKDDNFPTIAISSESQVHNLLQLK